MNLQEKKQKVKQIINKFINKLLMIEKSEKEQKIQSEQKNTQEELDKARKKIQEL